MEEGAGPDPQRERVGHVYPVGLHCNSSCHWEVEIISLSFLSAKSLYNKNLKCTAEFLHLYEFYMALLY